MLQAVILFDDHAEVVSADVGVFNFRKKYRGDGGLQNIKRSLAVGNNDNGVTVLLQKVAHAIGYALVGLDRENNGGRPG